MIGNYSFAPLEGPMLEGLFQPMHLVVIFFIALLVFGPKKLPELGKGLGEGIRALKEGMKDTPAQAPTEQSKAAENKETKAGSEIPRAEATIFYSAAALWPFPVLVYGLR